MSNSFFLSLLPNISALSDKIDDNKTVIDDIHDTDLPAAKTVVDSIRSTDVPNIQTNIDVNETKIDSVKTVVDNVHDTDLPAVKTVVDSNKTVIDDIHDTDLPAAKTVVDSIRSTDVPNIQTNIDSNETKIDTNKTLIEGIDMLPTQNVVHPGTAEDTYTGPNTFEDATAYKITDLLIQDHPAVISYKNDVAAWSDDKTLPIGMHSLDYENFGIKIKNLNAGSNCVFEITLYR